MDFVSINEIMNLFCDSEVLQKKKVTKASKHKIFTRAVLKIKISTYWDAFSRDLWMVSVAQRFSKNFLDYTT